MRLTIEANLDYFFPEPVDVLLAVEVAPLGDQRLIEDLLTVVSAEPLRTVPGEDGIGRRTWVRTHGPCRVAYNATVEVERAVSPIEGLGIDVLRTLPAEVVPYLWPSRYCEADRFEAFVQKTFGAIEGGAKLVAMAQWIKREMDYLPGTSDATTTAVDAFVSRQGVCRDFAHLMASFARAAGVPARLVSAYAYELDPPDFHAVAEVWLEGAWRLIDATELAPIESLTRIGVGRDATDIAFMTIFGMGTMNSQSVTVARSD